MSDEWPRLFVGRSAGIYGARRPETGRGASRPAFRRRVMPTDSEFVRRDLADALAEALEACKVRVPIYMDLEEDDGNLDAWNAAVAALKAYREATDDA